MVLNEFVRSFGKALLHALQHSNSQKGNFVMAKKKKKGKKDKKGKKNKKMNKSAVVMEFLDALKSKVEDDEDFVEELLEGGESEDDDDKECDCDDCDCDGECGEDCDCDCCGEEDDDDEDDD